jgi:hypothetical protein
MKKARFSCIVVIPVGPGTHIPFLNDTVRSVFDHALTRSKILIIDNTKKGLDKAAIHRHGEIEFLRCASEGRTKPLYGGLYFNLSQAWQFILDRYEFETVLRLDDDAVMINAGADRDAVRFFGEHPEVGCLGSYRFTCMGKKRDFMPAKRLLRSETSVMGALRNPRRWRCVRHVRRLARRNGYRDGEHCLGAVTFYSRACIERFRQLEFLERSELKNSNLGEDHIFGMMVRAAGLQMSDFATDGRPLGLAWRGLPTSPPVLMEMGKKIVHSVKSYGDRDQGEISAEFRRLSAVAEEAEGR